MTDSRAMAGSAPIQKQAAWFGRAVAHNLAPILSVLLLVCLLASWWAAAQYLSIPRYILPPPAEVITALVQGLSRSPFDPGGYWYHLGITATEAFLGFVVGCSLGVFLGFLISHFVILERIFYPYIVAFKSLPKIAIAPLLVVWFGFGIEPKVFITAVITFFPVLVNTMAGYRSVDPDRIDLARSVKANAWQILFKIRLPSALPFIFAGLNIAVVLAFLGAIVGEFVGAQAGIGLLILLYNQELNIPAAYALLIILAAVGVSVSLGMRYLEHKFCFWAQRERQDLATEEA
ncbi:ABC transporter permease [Devosia sp.]|uniref:ABC transporter permease n=1 Tax=Devosia sp. TaxID=1871048 RepID=UPI002F1616F8